VKAAAIPGALACLAPICLAPICLASSAARAEGSSDKPAFTLVTENDSFISISGDRHYTNGIYFSWTSAGRPQAQSLAQYLMLPGARRAEWRTGYFLGQAIFTPENLKAFVPPAGDRPYAGWLFGGTRLYRDSGEVLDKVEMTLGLVGPAALGSDVQKAWHAAFIPGAAHPNGWHGQLRDEPGLVLNEQRIWRLRLPGGPLQVEALPQANISLGNIYDYVGAGGMVRFGQNLAADWGPARIAPALQGSDFQRVDSFAWYVYGGGELRAVARNLFLDGSSFHTGPHVAKKALVGDLNAGAALLFAHLRVTAGYTRRSAEFRGQNGDDEIGSIAVSFIP